jgi:gliding motility-associated-like protein
VVEFADAITDETSSCDANSGSNQFSFTLAGEDCGVSTNPITPNGDGYNDNTIFTFPGKGSGATFEILIFNNRSGQVREITESPWIWDGADDEGKQLPQGTYIYIVKEDDETICDGTVTILR